MDERAEKVTRLLNEAREGSSSAADEVLAILYHELRALAGAQMAGRQPGHTLQPTALVNEAYMRLANRSDEWESRAHFLAFAAKAMRSVLVDHLRARGAVKRGGGREREPLHEAVAWFEEQRIDLLAMDEALDRLELLDARKRQIIELRFFAGLQNEQVAEVLAISRATVEREWALARAWLYRELNPEV